MVAFTSIGAFAEVVAVPADHVLPLPAEVPFTHGACLPMNYLTAHFALLVRGGLQAGQTVLVQGAAGGIGTASIQLAAALGARVIAVVSSAAKHEVALAAGAHAHGRRARLPGGRARADRGDGVDLVVDPVGGDRFTDSLRCLAPEGKLLVIGFTAGEIPTVRVNRLLLNNIDVVGVGWGAFALSRPGYLARQWADLEPHLRSGALNPLISATISLELADDALTTIDERRVTGKVVLQV